MSSVLLRGAIASLVLLMSACTQATPGVSPSSEAPPSQSPSVVRLLTHDSFVLSEDVVADFESSSGIRLEILPGGDAGEVVNRAVLSAGNPDADVLFGVDTTLLTRALAAEVFDPYVSTEATSLRPDLIDAGQGVVTPIDDGDVCVNIDDGWFEERGVRPPRTLDELASPDYRGLLVVENPATSSPGLAFLLATIARYGDTWRDYWTRLRDNEVLVVNGWSEAYLTEFSGSGGERPLVVSYSTSPPAEIVYASDPKPDRPGSSVMTDGCYRQVEFAGVLRGAQDPTAARTVVDWLLSPQVQADIPLTMFVFPARAGTPLPDVFTDFVTRPEEPLLLEPAAIDAGRDAWIEEWTETVLR